MRKLAKILLVSWLMMVIGLSSLSILEVGVRGDAWFHSQNFPLKFLCDYGELANKEVIVGETE